MYFTETSKQEQFDDYNYYFKECASAVNWTLAVCVKQAIDFFARE